MATPRRKRSTKQKAARRPSGEDRSTWTAGERHWDRVAARAGVKPMEDLDSLARGTPEDAQDLLDAIREIRADDAAARKRKERKTKAS